MPVSTEHWLKGMSWPSSRYWAEAEVTTLYDFLQGRAEGDLLSWAHQVEAMAHFDLTCAESEEAILAQGLLPARYQRNRTMISTAQQRQLFHSKVAVIGCGGLGGYILEELARLGVGQLLAIDPDTFEEHNLNRQLLSSPAGLGKSKAQAAAARIAEINPAVTVHAVVAAVTSSNAHELFAGVDVVADAVDNVPTRLELAESCTKLGIPLVHGAIAGWYGHVTTIFPGEGTLQKMYSLWCGGKGVEAQLGNPSFTPALVASFEVAEVCKVLLGLGRLLRHRCLMINLFDMEIEEISLGVS
jgi:molybdopterin/thiamine biosynthesis adenylyltransferase